jgi:DNA-binding transcriptional ArsR family regulator
VRHDNPDNYNERLTPAGLLGQTPENRKPETENQEFVFPLTGSRLDGVLLGKIFQRSHERWNIFLDGGSSDDFWEDIMENVRRLEGRVKGFANHRRIQILALLEKEPELSVLDIAERVRTRFRSVSAHLRRMAVAGLIMKRSDGRNIRHKLSPRGASVLKFLKNLK